MSRTLICFLMVTLCQSVLSAAAVISADAFRENLYISNAASGGQTMCITVVASKLVLRRCADDRCTPTDQNAKQRFKIASGWPSLPSSQFVLQSENDSQCLDAAGSSLKMKNCTKCASQKWQYDGYGHIVSPASGLCLVPQNVSVTSDAPLVLAPCTPQGPFTWLFQPSTTPEDGFVGILSSLLPSAQRVCLDAGTGEEGAPASFKPCVAGLPSQVVITAAAPAGSPGWPTSAFLIRFPYIDTPNLCLKFNGTARADNSLFLAACTQGPASQTWRYDLAGRVVNGVKTSLGNPICMTNQQGNGSTSSCSLADFSTKWLFANSVI